MLEVKNLTFQVQENGVERSIVENISFDVADGEMLVITGPNGGGKSTLAKIIAGIIKPTSGQIILDGEDITELDITERAKHGISYAFQQPVHFKGLTVKDLITIAAGRTMTVNEICEILSEVGLCAREYIDREINGSLSGGELKRIEIAMITARGTKLSIFDEPEAGIDLWSFNSLIRVFEKMRDERKLIEYAQYVNNYYGTPKEYVEQKMAEGKDVILEIEIQGALKVKKRFPDALLLFVTPPSAEELRRRLVGRGTETLEVINARLARAAEEASGMEAYDYLLINDDLDRCVEEMHQLIQLQHRKTSYHLDFLSKMREDLYHLDDKGFAKK